MKQAILKLLLRLGYVVIQVEEWQKTQMGRPPALPDQLLKVEVNWCNS